jgi:multisubunit Na+/H+ antiporter MnhC subunit
MLSVFGGHSVPVSRIFVQIGLFVESAHQLIRVMLVSSVVAQPVTLAFVHFAQSADRSVVFPQQSQYLLSPA